VLPVPVPVVGVVTNDANDDAGIEVLIADGTTVDVSLLVMPVAMPVLPPLLIFTCECDAPRPLRIDDDRPRMVFGVCRWYYQRLLGW
jgi:hypothetical protein